MTEVADDPFGTSPPAATDPFAEDAAMGEAEQPEAALPPAEPPIVDKEGEPVAANNGAPAAEAPAPAVEPPPAEAPAAPPEPAPAAEAPAPAPEPPAAPAEPPPEAASAPEPPAPAAKAPKATPEGKKGTKSELRRYRVLYQTGTTTWEELRWAVDTDGVPIPAANTPEGTDRPHGELLARNADHARKMAWPILGRPDSGVTVLPVPITSWKPTRLAPQAPRPEREALSIQSV